MRWKQQLGGCKIEGQSAEEDRRGDEKRKEHESTQAKNVSTCENYVVDKVDKNSDWNGICYVREEEKRGRDARAGQLQTKKAPAKAFFPFSWHK